jgi:hypothetical protein
MRADVGSRSGVEALEVGLTCLKRVAVETGCLPHQGEQEGVSSNHSVGGFPRAMMENPGRGRPSSNMPPFLRIVLSRDDSSSNPLNH